MIIILMFAYIVVFTCVWWIAFFIALPFRIKKDDTKLGHDTGAPAKTYLFQKIINTTIASLILSKIVIYIIDSGYLSRLADSYIKFLNSF